MKIYTKSGDDGTTGLIGVRTRKDDPRVGAYGDVDELNAVIGLARADGDTPALHPILEGIQRDLFAVGAQLADPEARLAGLGERDDKTAIAASRIEDLEKVIDECEATLPALRAFILPGGSRLGATLHLARTVCRRAERGVVALAGTASVDPLLVTYLNRLSDLLFVLARRENHRAGRPEDLW